MVLTRSIIALDSARDGHEIPAGFDVTVYESDSAQWLLSFDGRVYRASRDDVIGASK